MDLTSLLTMNKSDISELISEKIEAISEGWLDPVDVYIFTKKLEYLTKTLNDAVKDKVDSSTFGKDYVKYDVELSEGMTGVKYDFSKCGDREWQELSSEAEQADKKLKERQEFLKSVTKPMELVNTDSGETYTVMPPVKSGKLSPIAKLR